MAHILVYAVVSLGFVRFIKDIVCLVNDLQNSICVFPSYLNSHSEDDRKNLVTMMRKSLLLSSQHNSDVCVHSSHTFASNEMKRIKSDLVAVIYAVFPAQNVYEWRALRRLLK